MTNQRGTIWTRPDDLCSNCLERRSLQMIT
jgi:hypothetical protein